MLDYLFIPGTTHGKLLRRNLRIEAKLMLVVCTQNVILRRVNKVEVRFAEVPVLYMLLHGSPLVPFRFLVLNNIWIGRNSGERKIIPHCRLITALLKLYGAIGSEDKGSYKRFKPFDLMNLGPGWEYKESERYHKLKSDGQRWRALKDTFTVDVEMGGAGPSGGVQGVGTQSRYMGSAFDYAQQLYDQYWAHSGTMEQVVERRQPPMFVDWSDSNQMLFDHQTYMGASMERALKQNYDRQEQWNCVHMYAHQEEMNNRYLDDR
ncbi:hypothetical protein HanOQP8_Chr10g0365101 [Helianthus annuus]|nr:hypothetical protein HanOQP8_Chr10g0365101 [Helianthus annuus]KAJ0883705.1 hypothetical protein HanPSC8_Chr10g0424761 [Helianthus annuus]